MLLLITIPIKWWFKTSQVRNCDRCPRMTTRCYMLCSGNCKYRKLVLSADQEYSTHATLVTLTILGGTGTGLT